MSPIELMIALVYVPTLKGTLPSDACEGSESLRGTGAGQYGKDTLVCACVCSG